MTLIESLLTTEGGQTITTESGKDILALIGYSQFQTAPDIRLTVFSPAKYICYTRDASGDLGGESWQVQYAKTPGGCGTASLTLGLRYEEVYERGYWSAMNLVEISTGDDVLQQSISSGATKLYVSSTKGYDPNVTGATAQIYLYDGNNLTMGIPVTGVGNDSGGAYITVGSPYKWPGNPSTIPAYTAGATIIGRRRYCGYVSLIEGPKQQVPLATVTLSAPANIFNMTVGSYTVGQTSDVDLGSALYTVLSTFGTPGSGASGWSTTLNGTVSAGATSIVVTSATGISAGSYVVLDYGDSVWETVQVGPSYTSGTTLPLVAGTLYAHSSGAAAQSPSRWPHFNLQSANFTTIGQYFTGSQTQVSVMSMISTIMGAIGTGDVWSLVVDHDLTPRFTRVYVGASDTYPFAVSLTQGQVDAEPVNLQMQDQNTANIGNTVMVTGATNPATQQPYSAIVTNPNSIALYELELDITPVSNSALISDQACADFGASLLLQQALAQAQTTFRVFTRLDPDTILNDLISGLPGGDQILGLNGVTIYGFDQVGVSANSCPDSNFIAPQTWTTFGGPWSVGEDAGPSDANAWEVTGTGSAFPLPTLVHSPTQYVGNGRPFVLSGWINATNVTSGSPRWLVLDTIRNVILATATQTAGSSGTVTSSAFTIPQGTQQIAIVPDCNGCTVTNGDLIQFAEPMLSAGGSAQSYVPNYGAPAVFGLVSSVTSTYTSHGDSYQDVTFNPIEPDWNAAVSRLINAASGIIRNNSLPGTSLMSYTVTPGLISGLSYGTSSLTVTVPLGLAIFAAGTPAATVGGNSFTLPANQLTWVWLNSNNTYTTESNPTTSVSGAILLGYFLTSPSGVVGFTAQASIGLVTNAQFDNTTIDPSTGYIIISDENVHETAQSYTMPSPGTAAASVQVGWNFELGSTSVVPRIWLFANAAATNGYYVQWDSSGDIDIVKVSGGTATTLATSSSSFTKNTGQFHNITLFAAETTSGTVQINVTIDGVLAVQYADLSSPYTNGYIAAQFSGAVATNYIDPGSVQIIVGGQASSTGLVAQGSIPPTNLEMIIDLKFLSSSSSYDIELAIIGTGAIEFANGSSLSTPATNVNIGNSGGATGTWYYQVWLELATMTYETYVGQSLPGTPLQAYGDGGVTLMSGNVDITSFPVTVTLAGTVGSGGSAGNRMPL